MSLSVPTKPLNGGLAAGLAVLSGDVTGLFAGLLTGATFDGDGVGGVSTDVASPGGEAIFADEVFKESGFGFSPSAR
ncbi:MAG: hypothetical protein ACREBG_10350 [Pyrinomonadaceae bacterium]